MEVLLLQKNELSDEMLPYLFPNTLNKNLGNFKNLYLAKNLITDNGVNIISEWISKNGISIDRLDLSFNQIKNVGILLLQTCPITNFISFRGNPLDDKAFEYLSELINTKEFLPRMYLYKTSLTFDQEENLKLKCLEKKFIIDFKI